MRYALVVAGIPTGRVDDFGAEPPPDFTGHPTKSAWTWLPLAELSDPAFDPATQTLTDPVMTVSSGMVTRGRTVRALTPAELVASAKSNLAASDPWAARMGEDLLALLMAKGVVTQADLANLPQAAQNKLAERKAWRTTVQNGG